MENIKIGDLAKKLGVTIKELRGILVSEGFDVRANAKTISVEVAKEAEALFSDKEIVDEALKVAEEKVVEETATVFEVGEEIKVIDFSKLIDKSVNSIIMTLMQNGVMVNQNQTIDFDTASIISDELGVKIKPALAMDEKMRLKLDTLLNEGNEKLVERAPVVSIMGHVDHGKTSLLDKIHKTDVVSGEAGGITQAVAAYQVTVNEKMITFVDTPGHEAFTAMRARGASLTDIAILVVAADDSVMPQTREAISHARAANIPIIVAMNKIDKPGADIEKVKGDLAKEGLSPEDWGGDTMMIPVSAITGEGIQELEEAVLLQAEMLELKADANRSAIGLIVEAHLDQSLGPVATILVKAGTLNVGDAVVIGNSFGKIRSLISDKGKSVKSAGVSVPVLITGLSTPPKAGDILEVAKTIADARSIAKKNEDTESESKSTISLKNVSEKVRDGQIKDLKIIMRTDTKGSLEAIKASLSKLDSKTISIKLILADVGQVSSGDIMMAKASKAVIIAFNTPTPNNISQQAELSGIDISQYDVIYKLIEDITKTLHGMLDSEIVEVYEGKGEVLQIFFHGKGEYIVGCRVDDGKFKNKLKVKVFRGGEEIGDGTLSNLQRSKEQVKEVPMGTECGVKYTGKIKIEQKDVFELFSEKEVIPELELIE